MCKKYWFNLNVSPWRRFDPNALYAFAKTDPAVKGLGDSEEDQYYKLIEYTMGEDTDTHTALDELAPFRQEFTLEEANSGLYIASAGYDNDKAVFITGISPYVWIKEYGTEYEIEDGEIIGVEVEAEADGSFNIAIDEAEQDEIVMFGTVHGKSNMFPITGIKLKVEATNPVPPVVITTGTAANPVDEAKTNATAKIEEEVKAILAEAEAKIQTAEAKYTIGHNTVDFKVKAVTKVLKNGGIRVTFRFVSGEEGIEQLKAKGYKISYQFLRSTKKNGEYE